MVLVILVGMMAIAGTGCDELAFSSADFSSFDSAMFADGSGAYYDSSYSDEGDYGDAISTYLGNFIEY
ncbi:MAG: hypothetical protein AMXMBFR13_38380 [Phycisphaerae bacterium]